MRRIAVFLATLLQVSSLQAQSRLGVSEPDFSLAQRWLHTNCLAPDARPLVEELMVRRAAMQIAFTRALTEGPPAEDVAAVRAAATGRWRTQRAFIGDSELRNALPADQWKLLNERPEADAVRGEVESFVDGYRSNAMAGLAIVGDEQTLRQLRGLAAKAGSHEAVAARGALSFRESLINR